MVKIQVGGSVESVKRLPDGAQWSDRMEIISDSGHKHIVARKAKTGVWGCNCPGWIFKRHCSHLRDMGLAN
jgi:hypothetical protein